MKSSAESATSSCFSFWVLEGSIRLEGQLARVSVGFLESAMHSRVSHLVRKLAEVNLRSVSPQYVVSRANAVSAQTGTGASIQHGYSEAIYYAHAFLGPHSSFINGFSLQ